MLRAKYLLALLNKLFYLLSQIAVSFVYLIVTLCVIGLIYYLKEKRQKAQLEKLYNEATDRCRMYIFAVNDESIVDTIKIIRSYTTLELSEAYELVSAKNINRSNPSYIGTMPLDLAKELQEKLHEVGTYTTIEKIIS